MAKKKRADILAFEQGLAESADKAARLIMAGELLQQNAKGGPLPVCKPGDMLAEDAVLSLKNKSPYVSRGAYKLLTALEHFKINPAGMVALDAGASTGGFTDCLLQHGAAHVYAVDVGTLQLHEKLRADSRVTSMENVNLRLATPSLLPQKVDIIVADLSFISLTTVLGVLVGFLKPGGSIIALIKPQFEVGANRTVKGVVKSEELRQEAITKVTDFAAELGLSLQGVIAAAIRGPKGNQEYLAFFTSR